jgi:hypothetical protein
MTMKNFSRRAFVARTTKASAALLALIAGVVPELGKAAVPTATTADPAGPPATMDPSAQAALYSQALNDADVLVLMSTTTEQGRLDPPSSSVDFAVATTGQAGQQVFLPLRSYATGQTLAYVIYGPGTGIGPDGSLQPAFIKAVVGNTGSFQFAARGQLFPAPAPEVSLALFMNLFPNEYMSQQALLPARTVARAKQNGMFRKVMQAVQDPKLSDCLFKARYQFDACMQKAIAAMAAVLVGCLLMLLCLGISILLTPAGGWALAYSCLLVGSATLLAIAAAIAVAKACNYSYNTSVANCNDPIAPA